MGAKIESRVERITPSAAKLLLTRNDANRPVKRQRVLQYAAAMRAGKWALNGEAISISSSGRLLNGQHRLLAVIEADVAVDILVVRGVDDATFSTFDGGGVRSGSDVLSVMGHKNTRAMSSALAIVHAYNTGTLTTAGWPRVENVDLEHVLRMYPGLSEYVSRSRGARQPFDSAYIAAAYYLFGRVNANEADRFHRDLSTGEMLPSGDPVYLLRERILLDSRSKSRLPKGYLLALTIKAWEARRVGRAMRFLRFREDGDKAESFPTITGLRTGS